MDQKSGQKKWPLKRSGRCGEVAVSGGSTVTHTIPSLNSQLEYA